MHEADDAYMGYAGNDELIAALRTLVALTDKDQWRDMLSSHALALASLSTAEHEAPGPANPNEHRAEVVKTLKSILPRVRNDRLHADLAGMLRDYETPLPG